MKFTAMTAAHFPLLPLTCRAGREAKSVQADTDIDTCTVASPSTSARWPVLSSDHRRLDLLVFLRFMILRSVGFAGECSQHRLNLEADELTERMQQPWQAP